MPTPLATAVPALLLAAWAASAGAQAGIYTCIDAHGRRLTSDRPILACLDREQKELNASGTVRRVVPPSLTAAERAVLEARQRKLAEERQRQDEERRLNRALLARYPHQAAHDEERTKALAVAQDAIATAHRRIAELQQQRKALDEEAQFYPTPEKMPLALKRQLTDNRQLVEAQYRFIAGQQDEMKRIEARFDQELVRLKVLWAQLADGAAAAAAAMAPASSAIAR